MVDKGRISGLQLAILIYPTIIATGILLVPALTSQYAGRDMWLSPVIASITGIVTLFVAHKLNKIYPSLSFIASLEKILGRFLGKTVGFIYIFFYLHICGVTVREFGEFIVGNFLHLTPLVVVIGGMVFVCATAVRGGIEVLARTAQLFIPVFLLLFITLIVLLLPDLDFKNMLPMFEFGLKPTVQGSLAPQSWYSEIFAIVFFLPNVKQGEKIMKWGLIALMAVMVTFVITNIDSLFLFGEITSNLTYPVMSAMRYISVADFLEHLESVIMAIWVLGVFVKISVFYYALVQGTSQWLKLSNERLIIFPIGLLLIIFSFWSIDNLQNLDYFLSYIIPFYMPTIQTLLPLIILIVALLKKKMRFPSLEVNHKGEQ